MTYDEKVQKFWEVAEGKADVQTIQLFFALVDRWKDAGFPVLLTASNEEVLSWTHIHKTKLLKARETLTKLGIVCYIQGGGKGGKSTYVFDERYFPKTPITPPPRREKVKTDKVKAEPELNLFNEKRTTRKQKEEYIPFTLEEVKEVFTKAGGTIEEAEKFYYYYDSQDWYKSGGKVRVKRLDSAVNSWLRNNHRHGNENNRNADKRKKRNDEVARYVLNGLGETGAMPEADGDIQPE